MSKVIEQRAPLTESEVLAYLNEHVEKTEKQWGPDYIYTEWAREWRDKQIGLFRAGEVVEVHTEEYVDSYGNGCGSFADTLYSDGTVKTSCYGYLD